MIKQVVNEQKNVNEFKTPVDSFSSGKIRVTMWKNKKKDSDSDFFVSFVIEKNYVDELGKWHNVKSFNESDLPHVLVAVEKAVFRK